MDRRGNPGFDWLALRHAQLLCQHLGGCVKSHDIIGLKRLGNKFSAPEKDLCLHVKNLRCLPLFQRVRPP